jgi:RNA polymerase I-specific transcription initiation factor RRN7
VIDTLGLVYLGCVLRQEPVRIGDVFRWARDGHMPFLGAVSAKLGWVIMVMVLTARQIDYVPKEWRDRLPGWAHHALLTRYVRFHGGELHRAIMDLMLGYGENHGLVFPAIPAAPLLFLYVRELALPRKLAPSDMALDQWLTDSAAEVHPFAQKICRLLEMSFSFPTRGPSPKRYLLVDIPEVLLLASLVVATKHNYPLDGIERIPQDSSDPLCFQMDWAAWESEFRKEPEKKPGILQYVHMEPKEIWSMGKEDMDELLNWFQETQIEKHPTGWFAF